MLGPFYLIFGGALLLTQNVAYANGQQAFDSRHLDRQSDIFQQTLSQEPIRNILVDGETSTQECKELYAWEYPWSNRLGDDKFASDFSFTVRSQADCQKVVSSADMAITGIVFETSLDMASGRVEVESADHMTSYSSELSVLGMVVDRQQIQGGNRLHTSGSSRHPFEFSDEYSTFVGPIPVTLEYGVIGEAGLQWDGEMQGLSAELQASPSIEAAAYVTGGVAMKSVVEIEAGGSLNLIDDVLTSQAGIRVDGLGSDEPMLSVNAAIDNEMTALDGHLFGRVELLSKEVYHSEFYRWDGVVQQGNLVDENLDIPLAGILR